VCLLVVVVFCVKRWMCITRLQSHIGVRREESKEALHHRRLVVSVLPVGEIRVISLNLFMRCKGVSDAGTDDDWKASRLDEFITRYLPDYDVVCLQEAFGILSTRCRELVDRAERIGFHWRVVPGHPAFMSLKFMDSGLVILSRYPILHMETHVFKHAAYVDQFAAKSFQYCTIDLSTVAGGVTAPTAVGSASPRVLHLVNTHMQSDYRAFDQLAVYVKFKQLEEIRAFLDTKKLVHSFAPLLMAGDFNLNASVWTRELQLAPWQVSQEYTRAIRVLGFDPRHDVLRPSNAGGRPATSFCTYERTGIQKEVDTRRRSEDDAVMRAHSEWVNLPRSVDYLFVVPSAWLCTKTGSASVKKLPTLDPANKIGGCSDHYGVAVTLYVALARPWTNVPCYR
jgi:endonuclease/exonuclease/phosphatase family metal-dependent hydrolase